MSPWEEEYLPQEHHQTEIIPRKIRHSVLVVVTVTERERQRQTIYDFLGRKTRPGIVALIFSPHVICVKMHKAMRSLANKE